MYDLERIRKVLIEEGKSKQCKRCKKLLPATTEYFYKNKRIADNLDYYCKLCRKQSSRQASQQYYQQHKEEIKQYYQQHKEEIKQYYQQYYQQHKEEIKTKQKKELINQIIKEENKEKEGSK